ncbi:YchJ family protein [Campylobacterota bacterium DY0563]
MKISGNSFCPCGSQKKYKKCCRVFHFGENPNNALELMKSRYSAYAANDSEYIINTTHRDNKDFTTNTEEWKKSIHDFFDHTEFKGLEVLNFEETDDLAYVTFKATLFQGAIDVSFIEKSKFVRVNNLWLYHSGEFVE